MAEGRRRQRPRSRRRRRWRRAPAAVGRSTRRRGWRVRPGGRGRRRCRRRRGQVHAVGAHLAASATSSLMISPTPAARVSARRVCACARRSAGSVDLLRYCSSAWPRRQHAQALAEQAQAVGGVRVIRYSPRRAGRQARPSGSPAAGACLRRWRRRAPRTGGRGWPGPCRGGRRG